jgi:hypothetical protein
VTFLGQELEFSYESRNEEPIPQMRIPVDDVPTVIEGLRGAAMANNDSFPIGEIDELLRAYARMRT